MYVQEFNVTASSSLYKHVFFFFCGESTGAPSTPGASLIKPWIEQALNLECVHVQKKNKSVFMNSADTCYMHTSKLISVDKSHLALIIMHVHSRGHLHSETPRISHIWKQHAFLWIFIFTYLSESWKRGWKKKCFSQTETLVSKLKRNRKHSLVFWMLGKSPKREILPGIR